MASEDNARIACETVLDSSSVHLPSSADSLVEAAIKILLQPDPWKKAEYTDAVVQLWRQGNMKVKSDSPLLLKAPERPARADDKVKLLTPGEMPKRGKGGTAASRQAILHSLVHIENWAVDLSWDIIARFGADPDYNLPRGFYDDFVTVAEDECRHFKLLAQRLADTGSYYGAFPAHDGLWESAARTSGSLPARLAVEHCVHEARGLDVLPSTIHKFESNGDPTSAQLLRGTVYPEEVSHCAAGVRWLCYLFQQAKDMDPNHTTLPAWASDARGHSEVEAWFHSLVRNNFYGILKPPFNAEAREQAGFGTAWYLPLAAQQ